MQQQRRRQQQQHSSSSSSSHDDDDDDDDDDENDDDDDDLGEHVNISFPSCSAGAAGRAQNQALTASSVAEPSWETEQPSKERL